MISFLAFANLLPLVGGATIFAADSGGGWVEIVATYGIASPFVLLCLYVMREQRAEIKEVREDNRKISEAAMEKILPVSLEATNALKETAEALTAANIMMHTLSGRPVVDPVLMARLQRALEEVERRFQAGEVQK